MRLDFEDNTIAKIESDNLKGLNDIFKDFKKKFKGE
jgi:hypothetical protein